MSNWHVEEAKKRQQEAGGDRKSEEYQKSVVATIPQAIPIKDESTGKFIQLVETLPQPLAEKNTDGTPKLKVQLVETLPQAGTKHTGNQYTNKLEVPETLPEVPMEDVATVPQVPIIAIEDRKTLPATIPEAEKERVLNGICPLESQYLMTG